MMRLAPAVSSESLISRLQSEALDIKWTNRYDCPPGYEFNEDGWVETSIPYPKISITFLPYLRNRIGDYNLLLHNLLALRLLNNRSHEELVLILKRRYAQAFFGRIPDEEIMKEVVEASLGISDTSQLPKLVTEIFQLDTIWYSRDCTESGKSGIKRLIRNNYITAVRNFMPIKDRYKTKMVMKEADVTEYAVDLYWKSIGLDSANRTMASIVEAINELADCGIELNYSVLSEIAGVSVRSIQRYREMWML